MNYIILKDLAYAHILPTSRNTACGTNCICLNLVSTYGTGNNQIVKDQ